MIVVDVETTGIDPNKHSIISICAVDFYTKRLFYEECRPWKGSKISKKALEINGISKEELLNRDKSLKEILIDFLEWIEPHRRKNNCRHKSSF